MVENPLQTPVQFVPAVGASRAELLEKLGICTAEDLLFLLPRDVLDLTQVTPPSQLEPDKVQTVRGRLVDRDARQLSNGRTMTALLLACGTEFVRGVWFNQPWMLKKYEPNALLLFSGKPKRRAGRWEFGNPVVQVVDAEDDDQASGGVLPRYRLTDGLKMHQMRRITRAAAERFADFVTERLPEKFRGELRLPDLRDAVRQLHRPETLPEYEAARRRLIFDDLFEFQLGLALRRRAWRNTGDAPQLHTDARIDARIRRLFPFTFTSAQDAAIREIVQDLAYRRPMHRLLQADVGAGKTAVAMYGMLVAVAAGYQTVLMAPTELLANQHWATIDAALSHSRVSRRLLTGSVSAAQRRDTLEGIRRGEIQLIVGTQAVIQRDVEFHRLGLVVIDEQHKFGVAQRAHFTRAGQSPHVLVMTATPIPRSLCLTQYGDLDLTVMSELPPGRQRVVTSRVFNEPTRRRAWDFICKKLRAGRQAYVVCSRVEASSPEAEDSAEPSYLDLEPDTDGRPRLAGAEDVFRELSEGVLAEFRIGLVHGRMAPDEKAATMQAFRDGELDVLVSTTVIEVGVDVPNATLMVIENAERFGLSQLHQLRGRIGRGVHQGYCFLFSEATHDEAVKRLSAMESTTDGFRIAEIDFELRGPGDVLGTRQHGDMPLRVAHLSRDQRILIEAHDAAFQLVESGQFDAPEFTQLKSHVLSRFANLMELSQTG